MIIIITLVKRLPGISLLVSLYIYTFEMHSVKQIQGLQNGYFNLQVYFKSCTVLSKPI